MRHFLFEEKDYKYKPYFARRFNNQNGGKQDSVMALAKLLRKLGNRSKNGGGTGGSSSSGSHPDYRQKCISKMQYSNSMEAHRVQLEKYLVREGTDRDGNRAELYGTDINEYQENMVERNIRIFLSPQSDRIDLKEMTKQFMKVLEQRTGYNFYWQAANHYNTAHQHSHILINGVDRNGKEIDIPRDIVRTFMREYVRDICTGMIGNRTQQEIEFERSKEPEAMRFTRLDQNIKELCGGNFSVNPNHVYVDRDRILTRLDNLRSMGLCNFANGAYQLSPQWEDNLRANARYNTFLDARSNLVKNNPANLEVFSGAHGTVSGTVTRIFSPQDDTSNNHAVVVECPDGRSFFVPLLKPPRMYDSKTQVKMGLMEGDTVHLHTYASQSGRLTPVFMKDSTRRVFSSNTANT